MPYLDRMCILKQAVIKYNQTILASETPITWLRPRQIDALYNLRESKDLVVVLPTGYGKTLIFELIPFYLQCKVIVLEPLNVILNQLCSTLDGHVIRVTEHFQDLSKLRMGKFSYMVGHPEDILDKNVLECLLEAEWTKQHVCLIIDEAHCILHWQDEFRPAYKDIKNLRALFPVCTICAMTATINKDSIKSIKKELKLSRCSIINCTPLLRKNISLLVRRRPPYSSDTTPTSPYDCVFKSLFEDLIRTKENGSCFPVTIVYTRLVWCGKAVEQAKLLLGDQLYNGEKEEENCIVVQYHSPQYSKVNEYILHCLSSENNHIQIIFATIALGMGADLRKVHRVIHAGCPSSVEEYVQEVGHAGRDGLKAEAIIFYNNNDLSSKLLEKDMKRYLTLESGCRRQFLNNYFGCPYEEAEFICCDLCENDALGSAFCMKQIAGQKQIDRYLVHMALKEYVRADVSGEIAFHLHDDLLKRITETFDFIPMDINEIVQYYNIPRYIADSLNAILVTFRK